MSKDEAMRKYNYFVVILAELFKRIIAANDPRNIQYVCVDGERVTSYVVWNYEFLDNDRAYGLSLNLLQNGRLVCVNRQGIHKRDIDTDIRIINESSEMFYLQNDWLYCTISDIYNSIYLRKNDFGITVDSDWPKRASDFYISHL